MNWTRLLSSRRKGVESSRQVKDDRSSFQKDYDRLIFSTAFRRLSRKTQVHPLAVHDHVHNRMTHSLEVSCVGRSLGYRIGTFLPERELPAGISPDDFAAIVQSACLAHDFGNPPFGHGGEDAIRAWFRDPAHAEYLSDLAEAQQQDFKTFEGNAQGFRMLTTPSDDQPEGGLRITYATLGALIKYPWYAGYAAYPTKYGYSQTEMEFFKELATELGLLQKEPGVWCRHPLSYLMEAADDVCYAIVDLEDAVALGVLAQEQVVSIFEPLGLAEADRQCLSALRGVIMEQAVDAVCLTFMKHYGKIMSGNFRGSLLDATSDPVACVIQAAKDLAKAVVYQSNPENSFRERTPEILAVLLSDLIPVVKATWLGTPCPHESVLLPAVQRQIKHAVSLGEAFAVALDYISGMTDNFALAQARACLDKGRSSLHGHPHSNFKG